MSTVLRGRRARRTGPDPAAGATQAPPPPDIRIEVAPTLSGGTLYGRHDSWLRGRILAPLPIERVSLTDGETTLGQLHFGAAEAAVPAAAPGRGFAFTVPRPAAAAATPCRFSLTAHTADGAFRTESFSASEDPDRRGMMRLDSGPVWSDPRAQAPPPIILYLERAAIDPDGRILVHGWAVSRHSLVTVQLFLDGERIGAAVLGGLREDIAAWQPEYPNAARAGFSFAATLGPDAARAATLTVQAISQDGCLHEAMTPLEHALALDVTSLAPADPAAEAVPADPGLDPGSAAATTDQDPAAEADRRIIHLFCDNAALGADGVLAVTGWAVSTTGIDTVALVLDEIAMGEAETGLEREDVGEAFVTIPMARRSGFQFVGPLPARPAGGEHLLRIIVRNGLGEERAETVALAVQAAPEPAPTQAPPAPEIRLEIDGPLLAGDTVAEPVGTRLTIEGWAVSHDGIATIDVLLDGQPAGEAHHGLVRQDVEKALPDWPGSLRSGFVFHCPPRLLRPGPHRVSLRVRTVQGAERTRSFAFTVHKAEAEEAAIGPRHRMPRVEADAVAATLDRLRCHPRFLLLLRPADTPRDPTADAPRDPTADAPRDPTADASTDLPDAALAATLESLRRQAYPAWELRALAPDTAAAMALRARIDAVAPDLAARVSVRDTAETAWPMEDGAEDGAPLLIGPLCPGDELGCDALSALAQARAIAPEAELIYADELCPTLSGGEREAWFKPAFSPELLTSGNYIGRPWVAAAPLLRRVGGGPAGLAARGEYDLLLRCAEAARAVRHVPRLLCRRGPAALDSVADERRALEAAAARRALHAEVLDGPAPGLCRLRRTARTEGRVSIIIPTRAAGGHIRACLETLRSRTAHRDIETICVENIPPAQTSWKRWLRAEADRVIAGEAVFNWSRCNNRGAAAARGAYLLFLNDDIEAIDPDWLEAMLEHARDPEVGVVGARLLYPDRSVQHGGMFLTPNGIGRHAFRFAKEDDPGYFGLALRAREVSAVTGACMLMRREHFDALGGFDEAHQVINNDLDFCLRTAEAGKRVIYTPHATLIHHELASRGGMEEAYDLSAFEQRWRKRFALGDPFHNPNLSKQHDDFRPNDEPTETVFSAHPLFLQSDIRNILASKLDHIGDVVTAIPALRRLRQAFPDARLVMLASPATRAMVELADVCDEFIPFEFFNARSSLGERALEPSDLDTLRRTLSTYHFDLAIDLRKQSDTREILRCAGASLAAGFDHLGRFPFLDIALEWEGDRTLVRKRSHVSDDLLNLVEAVITACRTDRTRITLSTAAAGMWRETAPPDLLSLFDRPVVAVHPGVGNAMRQWPAGHFAALIDLITDGGSIGVVIIGGPDERALSDDVMRQLSNPAAVVSVVGSLPLRALPGLLAACRLYVGNNSGPKHIAAAVGVPTIGIHSGVVDATEWAPVGAQALALRRAMSCSPCYLNREADCPRALACIRQIDPGTVYRACLPVLAGLGADAAMPAPSPAASGPKTRRRR